MSTTAGGRRRGGWQSVALVAALALPGLAGCGRKPSPRATQILPPAPGQKLACVTQAECPPRWVCLAGACANPSPGAVATDPSNALTPEKVGQQVEQIQRAHDDRIDKVSHPE